MVMSSTTTTIYLCRHGHVHNPDEVFYGRLPGFFLSTVGQEEAKRLGRLLSGEKLTGIYASPLERTRETATYVAAHHDGVPIHTDERLLEIYSPTQGQPFVKLAKDKWNFYTSDLMAQGGESIETIRDRVIGFLEEHAQKHAGGTIVAVSHGDPIMIAKTHYANGGSVGLSDLRGPEYIETARGIKLMYGKRGATVIPL